MLHDSDESFEDSILVSLLASCCIFYVCYLYTSPAKIDFDDCVEHVGSFLFISLMLAFLTPVLQSLAVSYATDTAIGFSVLLMLMHLLTYDYTYVSRITSQNADIAKKFDGSPTSLNAIFMSSMILASRIDSVRSVFILLFMSLLLFGFGPFIRRQVRKISVIRYEMMGVLGTAFNSMLIFQLHHLMSFIYLCCVIFVTCGTPIIFIYCYTFFKNDIRGPWDLPIVK